MTCPRLVITSFVWRDGNWQPVFEDASASPDSTDHAYRLDALTPQARRNTAAGS